MGLLGLRLRRPRDALPKTFADSAACALLCVAIPLVFWFEIFVVMPVVLPVVLYPPHAVLGVFVLHNILGNFFLMIAVDTSTSGEIMPATVPAGWHVCAPCESVAPPRARHCSTCGTCVLKREHHCLFSGCCIGLSNHRFFLVFLAYMWVSTLYCSGLNACFIAPYIGEDGALLTALRTLLPGLWLVLRPCRDTLYGFLFSLNVIGGLFLSVLMVYYGRRALAGGDPAYDWGRRANVEVALGQRWQVAWLSPLVGSPLPYDGLRWHTKAPHHRKTL